jgi:hypothetical protein
VYRAGKSFEVEEFPKLVTKIPKECQRRFDSMREGLILLHTSCSVNVSRSSTLNKSSSMMKQNALNNLSINQSEHQMID